jgi:hypothetical protein
VAAKRNAAVVAEGHYFNRSRMWKQLFSDQQEPTGDILVPAKKGNEVFIP